MPNIEIHGLTKDFRPATEIRDKIFSELTKLSTETAAGVVVTTVPDECVNLALRAKPFLRIISPGGNKEKASRIVHCLVALGLDIEDFVNNRFIPAK